MKKQTYSVTTDIFLETRQPRKNGTYPVKLRVTFKRDRMYYTIRYNPEKHGGDFSDQQKYWLRNIDKSISMSEEEFYQMFPEKLESRRKEQRLEKSKKPLPKEALKTMKIFLQTQEVSARSTIAKISPFTFEAFSEAYFEKSLDDDNMLSAMESKVRTLKKRGKISTAEIYQNTMNAVKSFIRKDHLPFSKVTPAFLTDFEKHLQLRTVNKKNPRPISKTTISMYLRAVRSVFNESAPEETPYPFGKNKYSVPTWNHNKRAISQSEVGKIANYSVIEGTLQHKSRDLWLFSYLANGINFRDIANLKYSNIKGDTIIFERIKTAASANTNQITVVITRQIGRIIDRWGNKPAVPQASLFPILAPGMTPKEEHNAVKQTVKNTNKYMKRICEELGIPTATTYVARHSFATVLKQSGASVELISESLGHKNISTTQNYLADFEIDEKRKWAEKLLPDN